MSYYMKGPESLLTNPIFLKMQKMVVTRASEQPRSAESFIPSSSGFSLIARLPNNRFWVTYHADLRKGHMNWRGALNLATSLHKLGLLSEEELESFKRADEQAKIDENRKEAMLELQRACKTLGIEVPTVPSSIDSSTAALKKSTRRRERSAT